MAVDKLVFSVALVVHNLIHQGLQRLGAGLESVQGCLVQLLSPPP